MLPKLNPIKKTRIELARCFGRLENLLSTYNINELTEDEVREAKELSLKIAEAMKVLPAIYSK